MWHWGCWHYCIGFGVQGLGNNTADYNELVTSLEARGLKAIVAQVSRLDWLRNAAGLLDANYWKGSLQPRPVLDWWAHLIHYPGVALGCSSLVYQDHLRVVLLHILTISLLLCVTIPPPFPRFSKYWQASEILQKASF